MDAAVGYLGGTLPDPTYHDVCTGRTGHAEVVQVEFDPAQVSYEDLLDLGSMAAARKVGKLRSEGKTYRVHDGDVVEILFSK